MQDTKGSAMCLKDFDNFYETNSEVADDPDKIFVSDVSSESLKEDGKVILFDGTYTILIEGFPLLTIGTTDRNRSMQS
jgi:hypothetical protein